jgi:hypothetical protein
VDARIFRGTSRLKSGSTLEAENSLATVRFWRKQYAESESLARDVLARALRSLPPQHEVTSLTLMTLGTVLNASGRYGEARPLLQDSLKIRRVVSPDHWRAAAARWELGESPRDLREYQAAELALVDGCGGVIASTEPSDAERRRAIEHVIALHATWARPDKAAEWRARLPKPTAPAPVR